MFGVVVRLSAGFAGAMLITSILKLVLDNHILPTLANVLGSDNVLYVSLAGVLKWFPLIILITAALTLVYRGVIERRASGV